MTTDWPDTAERQWGNIRFWGVGGSHCDMEHKQLYSVQYYSDQSWMPIAFFKRVGLANFGLSSLDFTDKQETIPFWSLLNQLVCMYSVREIRMALYNWEGITPTITKPVQNCRLSPIGSYLKAYCRYFYKNQKHRKKSLTT